jgi:hypothetical protein
MTAVGDRVRTIDTPPVTLTVDSVALQGDGHTWMSTHDITGHPVYVAGEDTVPIGRHRAEDPTPTPASIVIEVETGCWPQGRGSTITGELHDPCAGRATPDSASYIVLFDRLGDHHDVPSLVARARCANELAEVIDRYVRPQLLLAAEIDVLVDLGRMSGEVRCEQHVLGYIALDHNTNSSAAGSW